jgi:hypothetical protein
MAAEQGDQSPNLRVKTSTKQLNQLIFNDGRDCHGELDTIAKERRS